MPGKTDMYCTYLTRNSLFQAIGLIFCAVGLINAQAQTGGVVQVGTLAEIAAYPVRSAPATAVSINETEIAAEIGARVERIHVRVGDVLAGDKKLFNLDCDTYRHRAEAERAKLAALGARIGLAERRLARTETLAKQQSVAEEILDERQSDLEILKAERAEFRANLALAKLDVTRCKGSVPFKALVTERLAAEGDYVGVGDSILRVLDVDNVEVSAQIQFGDLASIEQSAELWFEHADRRYPVKVRAALGSLNTATRNREIRLVFDEEVALPGAGGQLFWRDNRPHVPGNLLIRRGEQMGLFVFENETAKFVAIPDAAPGRATPVQLDLETRIVIEGFYSLSDGDAIKLNGAR